jgi:hypothetical protein
MGGIIDKITELIKDILKGWVLSNLDTMFTEVNETVSIPQLSWGNNRCKWR